MILKLCEWKKPRQNINAWVNIEKFFISASSKRGISVSKRMTSSFNYKLY